MFRCSCVRLFYSPRFCTAAAAAAATGVHQSRRRPCRSQCHRCLVALSVLFYHAMLSASGAPRHISGVWLQITPCFVNAEFDDRQLSTEPRVRLGLSARTVQVHDQHRGRQAKRSRWRSQSSAASTDQYGGLTSVGCSSATGWFYNGENWLALVAVYSIGSRVFPTGLCKIFRSRTVWTIGVGTTNLTLRSTATRGKVLGQRYCSTLTKLGIQFDGREF